jgi:hypothetical protein
MQFTFSGSLQELQSALIAALAQQLQAVTGFGELEKRCLDSGYPLVMSK